MALEVKGLPRIFKFDSMTLPDPDIKMSVEEVRKFYSGKYPKCTNATTEGPIIENDSAVYKFVAHVGTKG